jgi:hypothetical protein
MLKRYLQLFTLLLVLVPAAPIYSQETNVCSMLSPKLQAFLKEDAEAAKLLRKVLHEAFAKRTLQICYTSSSNKAQAYHTYTDDGVSITIRQNQPILDEYLCLVFEILNSENEHRFFKLMDKAERGTISREDFARQTLKVEFKAAKRAQSLIRKLTFRREDILGSYYYTRIVNCQDKFDDFLAAIEKEAETSPRDPLKFYEAEYDKLRKQQ